MAERTALKRLPVLASGTCGCGCECCGVREEPERGARAEGLALPIHHGKGCTCGCTCCSESREIPARA